MAEKEKAKAVPEEATSPVPCTCGTKQPLEAGVLVDQERAALAPERKQLLERRERYVAAAETIVDVVQAEANSREIDKIDERLRGMDAKLSDLRSASLSGRWRVRCPVCGLFAYGDNREQTVALWNEQRALEAEKCKDPEYQKLYGMPKAVHV